MEVSVRVAFEDFIILRCLDLLLDVLGMYFMAGYGNHELGFGCVPRLNLPPLSANAAPRDRVVNPRFHKRSKLF